MKNKWKTITDETPASQASIVDNIWHRKQKLAWRTSILDFKYFAKYNWFNGVGVTVALDIVYVKSQDKTYIRRNKFSIWEPYFLWKQITAGGDNYRIIIKGKAVICIPNYSQIPWAYSQDKYPQRSLLIDIQSLCLSTVNSSNSRELFPVLPFLLHFHHSQKHRKKHISLKMQKLFIIEKLV